MARQLIRRTSRPQEIQDRLQQLGARLSEAREARGMTRRQVGNAIGRSSTVIWDYEVGRREPPALVLIDAMVLLGIDHRKVRRLARVAA